MEREALREELNQLIGEFIRGRGLILVEIIFRYEGKDLFLRVLSDRPEGGITLEECTKLNREIGLILDEKTLIPGRYILEVSSPGLDRPLKTREDFLRCRNSDAVFFLREAQNGRLEINGKIMNVTEDAVEVEAGGTVISLPITAIAKAKRKFF